MVLSVEDVQVYRGHSSGSEPALVLHLRSDFAELSVPAAVRIPTVWVLGSSAAATRRLMTALTALQPMPARTTPPLGVQPAELVLDGVKWCNLLAAPVTPPRVAMSALTSALPPPAASPAGPLRIAAGVLQVRATQRIL